MGRFNGSRVRTGQTQSDTGLTTKAEDILRKPSGTYAQFHFFGGGGSSFLLALGNIVNYKHMATILVLLITSISNQITIKLVDVIIYVQSNQLNKEIHCTVYAC